jgi:hypothetical protein
MLLILRFPSRCDDRWLYEQYQWLAPLHKSFSKCSYATSVVGPIK